MKKDLKKAPFSFAMTAVLENYSLITMNKYFVI